MKKLNSLLFYALLTPTLILGSSALLAAQNSDDETDVGEQSMGQDANPATQNPEYDKEVTKSKYNTAEPTDENTGESADESSYENSGDQSGMQNKDRKASPPADGNEKLQN